MTRACLHKSGSVNPSQSMSASLPKRPDCCVAANGRDVPIASQRDAANWYQSQPAFAGLVLAVNETGQPHREDRALARFARHGHIAGLAEVSHQERLDADGGRCVDDCAQRMTWPSNLSVKFLEPTPSVCAEAAWQKAHP